MVNWNSLEPLTQFLLRDLHGAALIFMLVAYTLKIGQLLAKPRNRESTPARGSHWRGIRHSFSLLFRPWKMESQRRHWLRYVEFALLHLCIAVAIGVACTMSWTHGWLAQPTVVRVLQVVFGLATVIGLSRLLRRFANPAVRAISTPDDYFSLLLLTMWMASGVLAAPQTSEPWLATYFALTTLLLFYLPFGKISHYVYWAFVHFYVGQHFGHRGVYPTMRRQAAAPLFVPVAQASAGAAIWQATRRATAGLGRPCATWGRGESRRRASRPEEPAGGIAQIAGRSY